MVQSPPEYRSHLSMPITTNNFLAIQSALVTIGSAAVAVNTTFTLIPTTNRITFKICNTGTKTAYVCGSVSATGIIAAIPSTSTPQPTSTLLSTSTCDAIPGGAILTQDYAPGVDTISAVCASGSNTTLEISVGAGQ